MPKYTASALAAHTVASSIGGALIPLATFPTYGKIGYGWGNTIIAMINLGLCVIPLFLFLASRRRPGKWAEVVKIGDEAGNLATQT